MHVNNIGYASTYQIKGANGGVIWVGGEIINAAFEVTNGLATSSPAWVKGTPVIASASTTIGAPYLLAAAESVDLLLAGVAVVSAASVGYIGVALQAVAAIPATIPASYVYPRGLVASQGSIVQVNMVSATGALGAGVGGSATAGLAGVVAASTTNLLFGTIIKAAVDNGATTGVDGAGGAGRYTAGVLIHNW